MSEVSLATDFIRMKGGVDNTKVTKVIQLIILCLPILIPRMSACSWSINLFSVIAPSTRTDLRGSERLIMKSS